METYKSDPDLIISAHVYTDGSPVTDSVMQGMLIDLVCLCGRIWQLVQPGCVMHRGRGRAIDRAIAFLHAAALMFGFGIGLIEWLFSKIVSLTTDMGIEMRIPDVPNTLHHYIRRLQGVELDKLAAIGVAANDQPFPRTVRISGWVHMFGI